MKIIVSIFAVCFLFPVLVYAAPLGVDIVTNQKNPVANPTVTFGPQVFSFNPIEALGKLGTQTATGQVLYVTAPAGTIAWSVSLAATNGRQALWSAVSGDTYDYNDPSGALDSNDSDKVGGQLTWLGGGMARGDPNNKKCPATNISIGTQASFIDHTANSVTILSTANSGVAIACAWEYYSNTNNLSQVIPAGQPTGTYSLQMTLTIL